MCRNLLHFRIDIYLPNFNWKQKVEIDVILQEKLIELERMSNLLLQLIKKHFILRSTVELYFIMYN